MACMEWICTNLKCDWWTMNNKATMPACPKCGSIVSGKIDEVPQLVEEDYDGE